MQQRRLIDYVLLTLKGMAMGAADVIPGVSGGTIAFISGIYEELLRSISSIDKDLISLLLKGKFRNMWGKINGNFLLAVFLGIGISIFSLAKLVIYLKEQHPLLLWAFFFGLVLASVFFIGKEIEKWKMSTLVLFFVGTVIAFYISQLPPLQNSDSMWFLFVSGMLAVCAMILPGISGAFILVLLGSYTTILEAVDTRNIKIIMVVGLGAVLGLMSFARLLKYLFSRYKNATLAILTGFVFGSLAKIWPWKKDLSFYIDSQGEEKPLHQMMVWPRDYIGDSQLYGVLVLALVGFSFIFVLEYVAIRLKK
ncbi:MAG: DUF368 domain-containing protein [Flavobacteriaceae bacterium]|nr:DUF368 domain-containing protein [Flavobacteriaceae bacterium]